MNKYNIYLEKITESLTVSTANEINELGMSIFDLYCTAKTDDEAKVSYATGQAIALITHIRFGADAALKALHKSVE